MGNYRRVSRLVLSGYYGFRNSGDEAVLKSILAALEAAGQEQGIKVEPIVLSGDPEWTSRQYGVESVNRMKLAEIRKALKSSDGLISGGGSLLQDATGLGSIPYYLGIMALARWCGKPTFVYAGSCSSHLSKVRSRSQHTYLCVMKSRRCCCDAMVCRKVMSRLCRIR
jgi:polysaccharide pyruvyl transferase WcaK-like protein